jgi:hypothetical protein
MEPTELRPLTLGELLDRTFTLYRRNFWLFVGIMAIPAAISVPFSMMMSLRQGGATVGARPSPANVFGLAFWFLALFFVSFFVYSMAIGATTFAVSESYLGQKSTVRSAYGKIRGKFWRMVGAVGAAGLRIFGMVLLVSIGLGVLTLPFAMSLPVASRGGPVIAGVLLGAMAIAWVIAFVLVSAWSLRYAVCVPALLLENLEARASLRRSVQLTQGRRWQMFVAVLLCTVVAYAGVIVFQGPFLVTIMLAGRGGQVPQWLTFVSAVSGAVGGAITGPLLMIVLVLCYYDSRIRKEAFDLQFMMSSLDHPTPAQDSPSPA